MKKNKLSLSTLILTYIGYCLPKAGFRFGYFDLARAIRTTTGQKYSIRTLRKEFSNLKRAGLITHRLWHRRKIPALTTAGTLQITPRLAFKKFENWDGKFRLVLFNIPEKDRRDRTQLRQKLEELGFKRIQKSAYLSPHPFLNIINHLTTDWGIRQHLFLLEVDKIQREKQELNSIWDLKTINNQYKQFLSFALKIKRGPFWALQAKLLEQNFIETYKIDPHLPIEFLPKNWQGEKAYQKFIELTKSY